MMRVLAQHHAPAQVSLRCFDDMVLESTRHALEGPSEDAAVESFQGSYIIRGNLKVTYVISHNYTSIFRKWAGIIPCPDLAAG
jgi:hypothetical protein